LSPIDDMRVRTSKDLGALIRQRRRELGLNQQALAERVGVSRQWIVEVEQGKPRAELALVLRALDVLGLRLTAQHDKSGPDAPMRTPGVDIDAVVRAARKPRP